MSTPVTTAGIPFDAEPCSPAQWICYRFFELPVLLPGAARFCLPLAPYATRNPKIRDARDGQERAQPRRGRYFGGS